MTERGEYNIGQLVKEKYGNEAFLLGFSTYEGTVTAASNWGEIAKRKRVRPALPDSYEFMFHQLPYSNFLLFLSKEGKLHKFLSDEPRLQRAIGVIYRPETERVSHYFYTHLAHQFDAIIHIDHTTAVIPLDQVSEWECGELPETYPSGV